MLTGHTLRFRAPPEAIVPDGMEFSRNEFSKATGPVIQGDALRIAANSMGVIEVSNRKGPFLKLALFVGYVLIAMAALVEAGVIGDTSRHPSGFTGWKFWSALSVFALMMLGGSALMLVKSRYLIGSGRVAIRRTFLWFQVSHEVRSFALGFPVLEIADPIGLDISRFRLSLDHYVLKIHTSMRETIVLPATFKSKFADRIADLLEGAGWEYLGDDDGR